MSRRPPSVAALWRKLFVTAVRQRPRRPAPRLGLEHLEDRVTPSVTVTTTMDPATPVAGQLSLREAINMVNAGQVADNTIILPAGTYQNTQGALNVTHSLILLGAGSGDTIIDGGGTDRVILIEPTTAVNVQISGVTVRNGNSTGDGGGIDVQDAAGQSSTLTVMSSLITANTAGNNDMGVGGGIAANNGNINIVNSQVTDNKSAASGGGLADNNAGSLTVTNSLIADNTAVLEGGGIQYGGTGTLTLTSSVVDSNQATTLGAGNGGGINDGGSSLVLTDSTVSNNIAGGVGGGLLLSNPALTAILQGSTISGNTAGAHGGGIEDQAMTLTATNSTISHNLVVNGDGGGIDATNILNPTVDLTNVTLLGNTADGSFGFGGGLFVGAVGSSAKLVSCLVADNTATVSGGGVEQLQGTLSIGNTQLSSNSTGGAGGGLLFGVDGVSLVISDSTFNNNQSGASGGALSFTATGSSSLTNDTFTANTAFTDGGGLDLGGGTVALVNDTLNGNAADGNGGGVSVQAAGPYSFQNTIIAGNTAGGGGPDVFTATGLTVTDNGGNFIGSLSGNNGFGAGTLTGNPMLGPLADNGGPLGGASGDQQVVQTEALMAGSPAIGKGIASGAPTADERGSPVVTPPDIGAFQFQDVPLTVTVTPANPTILVNGTETFTITVSNTGGTALPADNSTLGVTLSSGLTATGPLTFPLAAIPAGQSQTFTVTTTATTLGTQTLTAAVTSPDATTNPTSGNATVTVMAPVQPATFAVAVTAANPTVPLNGTDSFTIVVTNNSANPLPAGQATLTVTPSGGLKVTGPLTFSLGALGAGQSQSFTVTATAMAQGMQTLTATVTRPAASPTTATGSATVNVVAPTPTPPPPPTTTTTTTTHAPVGALTLFAFGLGPTGIDLFEVDSAGDVFAQPLMGGTPLFLDTALQLPLAVLNDGQLLALLAGGGGQEFVIDIFNPLSPLVEPAVLAALAHR